MSPHTIPDDGIAESVGDLSNVLVLAPPMDRARHDACSALLSAGIDGADSVLAVTLNRSPDEWMEVFDDRPGDGPSEVTIIAVDDVERSAASSAPISAGQDRSITISGVSDPRDLTTIGVEVTRFLPSEPGVDEDERRAACFDSLTTLLQHVDLKEAFKFLHVLTGKFASMDVTAHYHMDPSAHDRQTIETLLTLFDGVVELTETDGWTVRRR